MVFYEVRKGAEKTLYDRKIACKYLSVEVNFERLQNVTHGFLWNITSVLFLYFPSFFCKQKTKLNVEHD